MARINVLVAVLLFFGLGIVYAEETEMFEGLITASNVDITADDGSIMPERLGVADKIYIIKGPKTKKKGWVRISKTPGDSAGIGWIEEKNVRTISSLKSVEPMPAEATETAISEPLAPPALDDQRGAGPPELLSLVGSSPSKVAILPFTLPKANDAAGKTIEKQFSETVKQNAKFQIVLGNLAPGITDFESTETLKNIADKNQLDGMFVGKISEPMGGSRIFQMRFYDKGQNAFTVEKVTKVPVKGDSKGSVTSFAKSCVDQLSGQ